MELTKKEIVKKYVEARNKFYSLQEKWVEENKKPVSKEANKIEEEIKNTRVEMEAMKQMYEEYLNKKAMKLLGTSRGD